MKKLLVSVQRAKKMCPKLIVVAAALTVASINQASASPITFYDTQSSFIGDTGATLLDDFSFPHPPGDGVYQIGATVRPPSPATG